ncbi:MAG TPA: 16S rRNA (uracil(1498)-N(3))-methyltransferase [Polyangia bacterium]
MSARRLYVPGQRLAGPHVTLTGPEHRHVARVLRARPGETLTLFDGAGGEVEAQVLRVERDETEVRLGARRAVAGPAVEITLLAAVPRGPRMDFLVQKTAELGVARIVPVVTERSVARPDAEAGRRARWEKIAQEAARQCGRADVPAVDPPVSLAAALALPGLPPRRLALFEGERARSLRAALAGTGLAPTALLVGPEGGFAATELAAAEAAGFVAVGLGDRILRVETAAIVGVALVAEASGMLG